MIRLRGSKIEVNVISEDVSKVWHGGPGAKEVLCGDWVELAFGVLARR